MLMLSLMLCCRGKVIYRQEDRACTILNLFAGLL